MYKRQSSFSSTTENETIPTTVIAVDVTGATFARQSAYLDSLRPTSQLPGTELDNADTDCSVQFTGVVRGRPPSSRRSSVVNADYGFTPISRRPSTRLQTVESSDTMNKRRAMSETREYRHRRQEMTSSSSSTTAPVAASDGGQQNRGRTTVRQLKRKNNRTATMPSPTAGSDNSRICSWRHSLCAGFKSSKCDIDDRLLPESRSEATPSDPPSTSSSITISVVPRPLPASRSQSLPRSFRSSFIAPIRRLLSSRSLSSTSDVDTGSRDDQRPSSQLAVESSSGRLMSRAHPPTSTTHAQSTTHGKLVRRSRSLERGSSYQTQQRSFSRTASVNSRSATSLQNRRNTSGSSSDAPEVYVEVPNQPWTYATVRLRPQYAGDVDRYQSSSGLLTALFFSCVV